jgi:prepilin-type N-terminal cleavage/methylation domain-containing protein
MMTKNYSESQKNGFSLMELITVILVIAILAVAAYPLLRGSQPDLQTQAAARQLESLTQKARFQAVNTQKPIRLVINCSRPEGFKSCYVDLQSATYTNTEVSGWRKDQKAHQVFEPGIQIVKSLTTATFDGEFTTPNIFWAIYMPSNQVFSDPRAFDLFMYHDSQSNADKKGWRLLVNHVSGQANLKRDTLTIP